MFGSHLSIAGSLVNALHEAESLKLDTVQVFTKNQQQWANKPLDPEIVREWRAETTRLGWEGRTVSHASYLINLASPDDELWRKSVDLMTDEIERCETLGIPFLVHHPGAFTTSSEQEGIARIGAAYRELMRRTAGFRTVSCLENTVGAGSTLGSGFEQLAALRGAILDATGLPERVGFCLDTCHAHAAGYDLANREGAREAFDRFDRICGEGLVRVVHVNDSKATMGSRRDLHQHIGEGTIGGPGIARSGFAEVVNRPAWRDVPKILETPKGTSKGGTPYDTLNLRRLKRMIERPDKTVRGRARGAVRPRSGTKERLKR